MSVRAKKKGEQGGPVPYRILVIVLRTDEPKPELIGRQFLDHHRPQLQVKNPATGAHEARAASTKVDAHTRFWGRERCPTPTLRGAWPFKRSAYGMLQAMFADDSAARPHYWGAGMLTVPTSLL